MKLLQILLAVMILAVSVSAQTAVKISLESAKDQKPRNVKAAQAQHKGRKALRVTDVAPPNTSDDDRLLILTGTDFKNVVCFLRQKLRKVGRNGKLR